MNTKKQNVIKTVAVAMILLAASLAQANFTQVENLVLEEIDTDEKTATLAFDLRWENSWRNATNHDAVWVFAKFRAPGSNHWQHAYLSTDAAGHTANDAVIEVGITPIGSVDHGVGVFVYSDNPAMGSAAKVEYRVSLLWDYGASGYAFGVGDALDVEVQAIEMVYVAEGTFKVGCGGTQLGSFTDGSWTSGATIPYEIAGEGAIPIGPEAGKLWGTDNSNNNRKVGDAGTSLPAAFPKGYAAFYCMKYGLTQGQFVAYLNRLTYDQQNVRTQIQPNAAAGTFLHNASRHRIHIKTPGVASTVPAVYSTDAPYVACNFMSWMDVATYTDWAGLRPMTELELEKACRGPQAPVANEFTWGTASVHASPRYEQDNPGAANESIGANYNTTGTHGNMVHSSSVDLSNNGPARVGIFATDTSDRVQSGASYWGIMELSGNLMEWVVSTGRGGTFAGSHGTGTLAANGDTLGVSDWPPSAGTGIGIWGGDFADDRSVGTVSNRSNRSNPWGTGSRVNRPGWRAVRTAP